MPKKFENEIKMEIMILRAQGSGVTKIFQRIEKRMGQFERSESDLLTHIDPERKKKFEELKKASFPSYAAIRSWVEEYNKLPKEIQEDIEYRSTSFTGFDMPSNIPDTAIPLLMEYKKWFYEMPMGMDYDEHFNSTVFSNELASWVYRVLCTIPKDIPIMDWDDKKDSEEAYPFLFSIEKDEVLLWAEKIMFIDMAHRFLGADRPVDSTHVFREISGPLNIYIKSKTREENFKSWKSKIYASLHLDELAYEHKLKADGLWEPHLIAMQAEHVEQARQVNQFWTKKREQIEEQIEQEFGDQDWFIEYKANIDPNEWGIIINSFSYTIDPMQAEKNIPINIDELKKLMEHAINEDGEENE